MTWQEGVFWVGILGWIALAEVRFSQINKLLTEKKK